MERQSDESARNVSHAPREFIVMFNNSRNCINISNDFARFFLSHLRLRRRKISRAHNSDSLYRTVRFLSTDDCIPKSREISRKHNNTFSSLNCQLGMFLPFLFFSRVFTRRRSVINGILMTHATLCDSNFRPRWQSAEKFENFLYDILIKFGGACIKLKIFKPGGCVKYCTPHF